MIGFRRIELALEYTSWIWTADSSPCRIRATSPHSPSASRERAYGLSLYLGLRSRSELMRMGIDATVTS